jgi:glycosyltransferase involved in cell wall biosynthesis
MTRNKLIVFGEDWGSHPSSTQHLMPFIAEDFDIVWVNSIGLRRPKWNRKDMTRLFKKFIAKLWSRSGKKRSKEELFPVVAPWLIPMPETQLGKRINKVFLRWQLRGKVTKTDRVWVWTSLPSAVDFEGVFGEVGWFYYCGDDFSALAGVDHQNIKKREQTLDQLAKVIWVASDSLSSRFKNKNTHILDHGVDWPLFASPTPHPIAWPTDRPVLGFYGALAEWIDQALIIGIAHALPDWRIMLIGPKVSDASQLESVRNIELVGPMPHARLPQQIQHWTAAILPFKNNQQIRACNPLKLREYLASGTPILSTPFPALSSYENHVYLVRCIEEAVQSLRTIQLKPESRSVRIARQRSVIDESWQVRALSVRQEMARICHS